MAFNAGSIVATLRLNSKKFTAGLKGAGKSTQSFGKKMLKVSNLIRVAFGVAAIREIKNFGGALLDLTRRGAGIETLTKAFERIAGTKSARIISQVEQITGALSRRQIMETANSLELLGIGMENLPRFVEVARSASIGLNKTLAFTLESLATGTARQSKLFLDNLAIIITVTEANKRHAERLGTVTSALSDTQQRAGFLFEVLRQGQTIIDAVGSTSEEAAEKVETFGAAWENFGDRFSKKFTPVGLKILEDLTVLLKLTEGQNAFAFGFGPGGRPEQHTFGFGPRGTGNDVPGGFAAPRPRFRQLPQPPMPNVLAKEGAIDGGGIGQSAAGMETLNTQFAIGDGLLQALGTSTEQFFATLVTGSGNASKAFAAFILGGVADVASSMGTLLLQTGIGMLGLSGLNPFVAISAGLALKSLAGIMRGASQNVAGHAPPQIGGVGEFRPTGPGSDDFGGPNVTIIIQGDMMGDPIMMDRLFERINRHIRGGATLQLSGG